jgi:site-specific DNA-cytosine methylase
MKVLIACEYSGAVRDAFSAFGHDVMSCDLLPTEKPGKHYQGDIRDVLYDAWDLIVAFPPCTHLAVSGSGSFAAKQADGRQQEGIDFFMLFTRLNCERVAIENPVGIMSTHWRKPDQIIQPWQFGHGETKKTCLWLKNLPKLIASNVVPGREQRVWKMGPSPDRGKLRSLTYQGIAEAMAQQWGTETGLVSDLPLFNFLKLCM